MRQYPSGAKKRDIQKKRKAEDAKNEGALLTFLAKRPVIPSSETTQTEITANDQSSVVSATASMDSESYPTELPEPEPPAEGSIPEVASNETVDDNNCSEILTDIAMWPANLTETMRNYVLDFKPKNVGDFSRASMLMTDRGRQYFRHLSEHNFYLTKANGQKERREWLVFSETSGSVYCYICKLFPNKASQFSTNGCSDWKNIAAKISEHENSYGHVQAMCTFAKRLNAKGRIDEQMAKQSDDERQYWREVLRRIVATVQFLSSQGLAFRGHDNNDGNFTSCLNYLSKFDPFLANHIARYGNKGSGSVSYLSHATCDEFIKIMGNAVRDQFISEVKKSIYFSLIVDSTPDVSHVDQLTVILRYVLIDGEIKERFLTFVDIYAHNAQNLEQVILDVLKKWGLDITKCRGQSYDNASNMSGRYSGLQARIKAHSPNAVYIPCSSHSLNLVGNSAAESSLSAVSYFDFIQNVYVWFSASTHRWNILKSHLVKNGCTIKKVSDTRWSARADAVFALHQNYIGIQEALLQAAEDRDQKASVRNEANALANKMDLFETALMTVLWDTILQRMNATSKSLQNSNLYLDAGVNLLESLKLFINNEVRNDFTRIEERAALLINEDLKDCKYQDEVSRKKKRKPFSDESNEAEVILTGRDNFIVNTVNAISDKLITELDHRIEAYKGIHDLFSLFFKDKVDDMNTKISALIEEYKDDVNSDTTGDEIKQFLHFAKEEGAKSAVEMYQLIVVGGLHTM